MLQKCKRNRQKQNEHKTKGKDKSVDLIDRKKKKRNRQREKTRLVKNSLKKNLRSVPNLVHPFYGAQDCCSFVEGNKLDWYYLWNLV